MPRRHPRAFARFESMRVLNRASALALLAALALLTAAMVPAEPPEVPAPAPAAQPAPPPRVLWFHRHPRRAEAPWVAAANPLAVDAGLEILARGGKAVDAAVAVQAMLGLVEPQSSGIGGGAFLLYYDAGSRKLSALEGRERAPAGAQPDMFLDEHGKPLPFVEAVRSGRSTGVPGAIAMLYAAHSKLGKLRWKELFQPAIRAATAGFKVPARMASFLGEGSPFPPTNEVRMMFARPDGETVQEGDLFRNPKYAHTLERIARQGPRALYEGEIAREIVATTHLPALPGTMTLKDLASYRASWTEPVCRPYRGNPPLRDRGCGGQCRIHDHHHRIDLRLRAHGRGLRAQQSAHRLLVRAGRGRPPGRQRGARRQAAALLDGPGHRSRSRRQLRGRARLARGVRDSRIQRQGARRAVRLEAVAQGGDRAAEPDRARRRLQRRDRQILPRAARRAPRPRHRAQARACRELGAPWGTAPRRRDLRGRGRLAPRGRGALAGAPRAAALTALGRKAEVVRPAPARPVADHPIGIVAPAGAAVVARQRLAHVVALVIEIEAQDGAAHADVGCDVDQVVAAHAEPLGPERHHLHETHGAAGRDRPAVEAALDVDERHHEARRQTRLTGPVRLAVDLPEDVEPLVLFLHDAPQPRLHQRVPHRRVVMIGEALRLTDGLRDHLPKPSIELLIRVRRMREGRGEGGKRDRGQRSAARRARGALSSQAARAGRRASRAPGTRCWRCRAGGDIRACPPRGPDRPPPAGVGCRAAPRRRT